MDPSTERIVFNAMQVALETMVADLDRQFLANPDTAEIRSKLHECLDKLNEYLETGDHRLLLESQMVMMDVDAALKRYMAGEV
jgi:hypothetical protein